MNCECLAKFPCRSYYNKVVIANVASDQPCNFQWFMNRFQSRNPRHQHTEVCHRALSFVLAYTLFKPPVLPCSLRNMVLWANFTQSYMHSLYSNAAYTVRAMGQTLAAPET